MDLGRLRMTDLEHHIYNVLFTKTKFTSTPHSSFQMEHLEEDFLVALSRLPSGPVLIWHTPGLMGQLGDCIRSLCLEYSTLLQSFKNVCLACSLWQGDSIPPASRLKGTGWSWGSARGPGVGAAEQ